MSFTKTICTGIRTMVALALTALPGLVARPAAAAPAWLIATPIETAQAGAPFLIDLVKPPAQANWPETIMLRLARGDIARDVTLTVVAPVSPEDTRRTYRGVLPTHLSGLVRAELAGAASNRLALLVAPPGVIEQMRSAEADAVTPAPQPEGRNKLLLPVNEPALSANEPMYLVVGSTRTATQNPPPMATSNSPT